MNELKKTVMLGEMAKWEKEWILYELPSVTEEEAEIYAKIAVALKIKQVDTESDEYRDLVFEMLYKEKAYLHELVMKEEDQKEEDQNEKA